MTTPKEKEKQQGTDMVELFSGLTIEQSDEKLPSFRQSAADIPNPFGPALKVSIEKGTTVTIYVPPDAVQRAVFLLNAAAKKENVGVRVVVNVQRDEKGAVVKNAHGKATFIVEQRGENKGKVLIRFQGKAERKAAPAPRPYSIVKSKTAEGKYAIRHRASQSIVADGLGKDAAKAKYEQLKAEAKQAEQQQETQRSA